MEVDGEIGEAAAVTVVEMTVTIVVVGPGIVFYNQRGVYKVP